MADLSITRLLVEPVLVRAKSDYSVWLNGDDHIMSADEIVARSFESDALMICHSEILSSDVVARLSDRLRIVANYSVGVDHCDLSALKDRGIVVTNTPDVLSDATAEIAMLLLLGASRRAYFRHTFTTTIPATEQVLATPRGGGRRASLLGEFLFLVAGVALL